MESLQIKIINDLKIISQYEKDVDAILLDAWDDKSLGGTGKRVPKEFLIQ